MGPKIQARRPDLSPQATTLVASEDCTVLSKSERAVLDALRAGARNLDEVAERSQIRKLHAARVFSALEKRGVIVVDPKILAALEVLEDVKCGMTLYDAMSLARSRHALSRADWDLIEERVARVRR